MYVLIHHIEGKAALFYINKRNTVRELKSVICSRTGEHIDDVRLSFGRRNLEDYETIEKYKIKKGSCIDLLCRLRGD